jgi:polyhydroxybutyrate depolymerase
MAKAIQSLVGAVLFLIVCRTSNTQAGPQKRDKPLRPGDHFRALAVRGQTRSYLLHVPRNYNAKNPVPVVLALHGVFMDGFMMAGFSGLNQTSDKAGFVVIYPDGAGFGLFRIWNAGGFKGTLAEGRPDDVVFIRTLLDDLDGKINVDKSRIFATGMSNGAMMCYRLAAELSDRIAAIAPVAGTMAIENANPKRSVSVIHFHGTADDMVPFGGPNIGMTQILNFKSVEESIRIWCKLDQCPKTPTITSFPEKEKDGTAVKQSTYGPGRDDAEVVLIEVSGGGHTWPGRQPVWGLIGKSTVHISANDLIWQFFERHPMRRCIGCPE